MGRMLSLKPQPPLLSRRPSASPAKLGGGAVAVAPPLVETTQVQSAPRATSSDAYTVSKPVFYFALASLFVRFGVLPEVIAYVTGVNTYLLYVTAVPAI